MIGVLLLGLALVAVIGVVCWPARSRRWGGDEVPLSARQWSDPAWEPWDHMETSRIEPSPVPATYHVGEPLIIEPPRRQIGGGR